MEFQACHPDFLWYIIRERYSLRKRIIRSVRTEPVISTGGTEKSCRRRDLLQAEESVKQDLVLRVYKSADPGGRQLLSHAQAKVCGS